jgi:NitT/TauT family transport system substrate-binding protein
MWPRLAAILGWGTALALALAACGPAAPASVPAGQPAPAAASPTQPPRPAASGSTTSAAPAPTAVPAPQAFHMAGQAPATDAGIFVAMERGYFAEQGVDLDYVVFASGSDMIPALATRQVDGAGAAVNPATINAVARGIEMKAVADKGSLPPGFGWEAFLVRKDHVDSGRFRGPADLRGMVFGTTPPINAGAGYPPLERVLREGGLTQDDLRIEALSFADLNSALAGKALDVAIQLEPLVQAAVAQGIAVRWRGLDEVMPYQQIAAINYGPSIIRDNPALGRAFMVAYLKGVRDYNRAFTTGAGRAEVVAAIAKHSTVKDPAIVDAMAPAGLNPDGRLNLDSLIDDQRFYVEKGTLSTPIDMAQFVDHSYVDAALAVLGPS